MRFAVLDAVLPFGVALGALDLKVVVALRFEHLLDDVEHAQVLKNLALARERQEPQPGHDLRPVRGQLVFAPPQLHEAANQAVNDARPAVRQLERDDHGAAQQFLGVDGRVL